MTFVVFLVGVPLAALSLVITVAILKIGWDSIRERNLLILNPSNSTSLEVR